MTPAPSPAVLVVEDHPVIRALLVRQLQYLGYAAEGVADAEAGLQSWRRGNYQMVCTDLALAGLDGEQLIRILRAEQTAAARPLIIAITGNCDPARHAELRQAGADGVLIKPVDIADLRTLIRHCGHALALQDGHAPQPPQPADVPALGMPQDLDTRVLLKTLGDGHAREADHLVALFIGSALADIAALEAALTARDHAPVSAFIHRQRSAAVAIGARRFLTAVMKMHGALLQGDWRALDELCRQLPELLSALKASAPGLSADHRAPKNSIRV